MSEKKLINRWIVVAGALLIQMVLGAVYTWSLFNAPLVEKHGWDSGAIVFTFSITMATFAVFVLIAGRLQDKLGPKKIAVAGGLLAGLGVCLASQATSVTFLYLTYGFMTGAGMGAAYVTPVATCTKWFPDKRGFITGLTLAAVGLGGMLFTPMIIALINTFGVMTTFLYLGIGYGLAIIIGAQALVVPPAGYKPPGWVPPKVDETKKVGVVQTQTNFTTTQMMKTPQFYLLFAMYFIGASAGLMVISVAADIGVTLANLDYATAGTAVVTISLFNAAGRFGWGGISDKIGRVNSLLLMFTIMGCSMLYMSLISLSFISFLIVMCLVGLCFGGYLSIFPSVTADWFGTKFVGNNYGAVFMAYGVSSLTAPLFAATVGFQTAFITAAVLCAIALVMAYFTKVPSTPAEEKSIPA